MIAALGLAFLGMTVIAGAFAAALLDALKRETDLVVQVERLTEEADGNQKHANDLQQRLSRRRQPSIRPTRKTVPFQRGASA